MIALSSQYVAVLDTCVLAPMPLCDTLLRLAEEPAFYIPNQFHLNAESVVAKLDGQAAIRRVSLSNLLAGMRKRAPRFVAAVARSGSA